MPKQCERCLRQLWANKVIKFSKIMPLQFSVKRECQLSFDFVNSFTVIDYFIIKLNLNYLILLITN
jgi:hypothetical protein